MTAMTDDAIWPMRRASVLNIEFFEWLTPQWIRRWNEHGLRLHYESSEHRLGLCDPKRLPLNASTVNVLYGDAVCLGEEAHAWVLKQSDWFVVKLRGRKPVVGIRTQFNWMRRGAGLRSPLPCRGVSWRGKRLYKVMGHRPAYRHRPV